MNKHQSATPHSGHSALTPVESPVPPRPGERAFALALVICSVVAFSEAYTISGFTGLTTGGVMPMVASAVMIISSIVILFQSFQRSVNQITPATSVLSYLLPLPLVGFSALVAAYAWLIPLTGFIVASGLFLFVSIWILWRKGTLITLLIACLSVAAIHVLFRIVFQVVLPTGSLWQ